MNLVFVNFALLCILNTYSRIFTRAILSYHLKGLKSFIHNFTTQNNWSSYWICQDILITSKVNAFLGKISKQYNALQNIALQLYLNSCSWTYFRLFHLWGKSSFFMSADTIISYCARYTVLFYYITNVKALRNKIKLNTFPLNISI